MPNNSGGDPLDEDYAPHLYGKDGKFVGDKTKDKPATGSNKDPRTRLEVGDYRVVAPNGRPKDGRFFVNGSLVVEKKDKPPIPCFAEDEPW